MKVSVDDEEIFQLSETQKKVMMNDIPSDIFDEDMKRRLHYILTHKYEECFKRLKNEWEPKLKLFGYKKIPTDDQEFAELIFSQPEYKNRSDRDRQSEVGI